MLAGMAADELLDWMVGTPLRVALICVSAFVVNRLLRWLVDKQIRRIFETTRKVASRAPAMIAESEVVERVEQRARTVASVFRSFLSAVVWSVAVMLVLGELGVNLGPLIAGAGIAGVAIGLGAQNVVRDFLAGLFILAEDQLGVGDVVDLGPATGVVERVTLRSTVIRALDGTVWFVPNGQITRVGNLSQFWGRAVLDLEVPRSVDLRKAMAVMQKVAEDLAEDPAWRDDIEADPEVWGVERLGADTASLRLVVKTDAGRQAAVLRELRLRTKEAFDAEGLWGD
ncbi:MAG: mechanosensitive ion channel protein MscS [Acidimicrobiales bacterium]|nr:MAG: mechanosensitive ion channel protein MscS [Acidimicrobiales bacterium]